MSWYGASDDIEEPVHHVNHHQQERPQPSSAMLDLQAHLDTEREAHRVSKQAVETAKLDIKEWMNKAQQAAAETQAYSTRLETCEASLKLQYTQRENLEQSLAKNKSRLEMLEKQILLHDRNSASEEAQQMHELHNEVQEERKKRKVADDGMQYWKSRAQSLENEKIALERQIVGLSQSQSAHSPREGCSACQEKDSQLADQQDKVIPLESQLSQLRTAKATLESSNIQLTNQYTALERTSTRKIAELQESIENLSDEVNDLKMEAIESERKHSEDVKHMQSKLKVEQSTRQTCESELKAEKGRFETLHAELLDLENTNESLRLDIDAAAKASLTEIDDLKAQIQSMELHFHSSNSDLLSSRAALQHTQSKLSSLENLLNQFKTPSSPSSSSVVEVVQQVRSFDDVYVLSLKSELEDEVKLRTEYEKQIEGLEERVHDLVSNTKNRQDDKEEVDILQNRLKSSTSRLFDSQNTLETLNEEQEGLRLDIDQLRSALADKEEMIASMTRELEAANAENGYKEDRLADMLKQLRGVQAELEEKNDEMALLSVELESLKRDALSLKNQIDLSSLPSTPTPPSRKKHFRTNSAPFSPSPLRNASFPPPVTSPSAAISANLPYSHSLDVEDLDQQTLILVTRLRQERDEAVSQLTYYLVEHRIAAQCSEEEMRLMRSEIKTVKERLEALNGELRQAEEALLASQEQEAKREGHVRQLDTELQSLQCRYDETLHNIHEMEASESDSKATQADLRSTLAEVMDERDALSDDLHKVTLDLSGAQNAALSMQAELDLVRQQLELQIASAASSSADQITQLEDRIETLETQLEGAQNAALELQDQVKDLIKGREMVEGVLRLQRDEIYSQLMKESARSDVLKSEYILQKIEKEEMHGLLQEERQQVQSLIVALAQSSQLHREVVRRLQGQLQNKTAQILALQEAIEKQPPAAPQTSETTDEQVNTLILTLVQASSELSKLRVTSSEQQVRLTAERNSSNQLRKDLLTAQGSLAELQDKSAKEEQESGHAANRVELEEQLRHLLEKLSAAQELAEQQEGRYVNVQEESSARASEIERLNIEIEQLQSVRSEIETALTQAQSVEASLLARLDAADQTISEMQARSDERALEHKQLHMDIEHLKASLQDARDEADSLKENLRAAEEEGRNIVDDFNALSEEYEKTQKEVTQLQQLDETKHIHTEQMQQQLADSTSRQEQAMQKYEQALENARELGGRLKQLEDDLENKQVEVEETDDRYLASLKTIKKQEVALDRLKVRIEALQRANGLLSKAVPATTPDVMAPAPPSAKKRGLPQEFVAPDPGPTAIVAAPPASSVREPLRSEQENVRPSSQPTLEYKSTDIKIAVKTDVTVQKDVFKPIAATTATSTVRPRKPLAAVPAQAISQASLSSTKVQEPAKQPSKLGSLSTATSSRPAFKPTPSLSSKPLGSRTDPKDPKSLLAALQALKRPAPA